MNQLTNDQADIEFGLEAVVNRVGGKQMFGKSRKEEDDNENMIDLQAEI